LSLDPIVEPILWFIVSGCFLVMALYFGWYKYPRMGKEGKPFILGIALFALLFMIGRTLETFALFFGVSPSLYEILHLLYFIIPWTGNTIFYFVFEKYIMKLGMQKNTRYILTISSAIEGTLLCFLIFAEGNLWWGILIAATAGFFILGFFPVGLFIYLSMKAISRDQKVSWLVIMAGFILFVVSVAIELPEAWVFTQNLPAELIHYGAPIMQALGVVLMGSGFAILYKNI